MGLKAAPVVERWCAYAPTPRRSGEDSPLRRAALTFGLAERPARIEHVAPPRRAPVHPGAGAAAALLRAEEVASVQRVARNQAVTVCMLDSLSEQEVRMVLDGLRRRTAPI